MKHLSKDAEGFLRLMADRDEALARSLREAMTDRTITHLDGEPVLATDNPRQLVLGRPEQLRLDISGGAQRD